MTAGKSRTSAPGEPEGRRDDGAAARQWIKEITTLKRNLLAVFLAAAFSVTYVTFSPGPLYASDSGAEPLPRRAFFRAQLEAAPAEAELAGVLIRTVFEGHSAAKAGLREGDLVVSMDGEALGTVAGMLARLRQRRTGERFALEYVRDGQRRRTEVLLQEMPRESHLDIEVLYDSPAESQIDSAPGLAIAGILREIPRFH
jgi:PDZ domain-containing secreted protein